MGIVKVRGAQRRLCGREYYIEIAGLVECFPVIGETSRCSDILVGNVILEGKKEEIRLEERKASLMSR